MRPDVLRASELAHRRRIAMAMRSWRSGEGMLSRIVLPDLRRRYEHAVRLAVLNLPPDGDMAGLLAHYCERGGTVDRCVEAACLCGDPDGGLQPSIVRNAAYWRRLQAAIGALDAR